MSALSIKRMLFALLLLLSAGASAEALHLARADVSAEAVGSFLPPPARLAAGDRPSAWFPVPLPDVFPRSAAMAAQDGVVSHWYRFRLRLAASTETLYLYVPRWQTVGKIAVYGDDRLLYRSRSGPVWNGFNHPLWIPLAEPGASPPQEILVRLDYVEGAGSAFSTVWVGKEGELQWRYRAREFIQAGFIKVATSAFLLTGIFSLFVGLWLRQGIYLMYFAASVLSLMHSQQYIQGLSPLPIPEEWFGWMIVNALGWMLIVTYAFCFRLHGRRFPLLERGLVGSMLLFSLLTLPWLSAIPNLNLITPYLNLLFFGVLIVLSVAMVVASWRSSSREGLLVSGWNMLNIPVAVHDLLLQNYLISIEGIYLLPYTVLGTFVLFMLILLRRYVAAIRDVERANERLEVRLRERERELQESHAQLRRIEHQQMLARERQRLMRDMHDGMGSALVTTLVAVERGGLSPAETAVLLRDCIDELRLTIDSLDPSETDLGPLLANLRYRLEPRLRQAGVDLRWRVGPLPPLQWLDPESTLHVLRIIQEVFTNLLKHSACTCTELHTEHEGEGIAVVIRDNGRAFAGEADGRPGKGLANLRHRAALVQARLTWESASGQNIFRLWLPLSRPGRAVTA